MSVIRSALREKKSANGDTSMTRLIVFLFAISWVVRFTFPALAEGGAMVLVALGRMPAADIPFVGALGDPMAWLGAMIVMAMPLKVFMERVSPEHLPAILGQVFGGLFSRASNVAGGASGGSGRTEGTDDRFRDDESGE